jgi:Lon protease-like protein
MYHLSLFPLQTVLFPGTALDLHIFEARYRMMVIECLETGRPFGVTLIRKGQEAHGPLAEPHRTGCTARISQSDKLADGTFNLTVVGEERFRILELNRKEPYLVAEVETWILDYPHTLHMLRALPTLRRQVLTYLKLINPLLDSEITWNKVNLPEEPLRLVYLAASLLQLPPTEKQPLLEADTANQLLNDVVRLFRRETAVFTRMESASPESARRAAWQN